MTNTTASTMGLPVSEWTSPFDFLLGAHIPALDGHVTREMQSILLELLFWCCAYLVYGALFSEVLRSFWSKTWYWTSGIKNKKGIFCGNAQDDIVLMNMLGIHHVSAGSMCLIGSLMGDNNLWRHGYLLEVGFEIADVLSMPFLFNLFPYQKDNMKWDSIAALMFHHVACITACLLVFHYGLDTNEHIHQATFYCLIGAACSTLGAIFVETRDLNTQSQTIQATIPLLANMGFWYYCRFHALHKEGTILYEEIVNDPRLQETDAAKYMIWFSVFLTIFNSIVLLDVAHRASRYIMRCIDGKTQIDTGKVPLAREDRFTKQAEGKKVR